MSIDLNNDVQVTEHPVLDSSHLYNSESQHLQRAVTQPTPTEEKQYITYLPDEDIEATIGMT